jgi:hypothetical protein
MGRSRQKPPPEPSLSEIASGKTPEVSDSRTRFQKMGLEGMDEVHGLGPESLKQDVKGLEKGVTMIRDEMDFTLEEVLSFDLEDSLLNIGDRWADRDDPDIDDGIQRQGRQIKGGMEKVKDKGLEPMSSLKGLSDPKQAMKLGQEQSQKLETQLLGVKRGIRRLMGVGGPSQKIQAVSQPISQPKQDQEQEVAQPDLMAMGAKGPETPKPEPKKIDTRKLPIEEQMRVHRERREARRGGDMGPKGPTG